MEKRVEGRTRHCTLKFDQLAVLLGFLYGECCVDMPSTMDCSSET